MKFFSSKIVAFIVTLTMVFSIVTSPIVNAASENATDRAAKFLEDAGVLKGDNGNLMLDKKLTRQDAVVLLSRLLGKEDEAKSYQTNRVTFKDIKDDYYLPYIAWAQDNELVQGYNKDTFGFGEPLTGWQTKALMVRALGYVEAVDSEIDQMAQLLGLTNNSTSKNDEDISRANMAILAYNTVRAETIGGKILGETLGIIKEGEQPILSNVKASATTTSEAKVSITGKVTPADSEVIVGDLTADVNAEGSFAVDVDLVDGKNVFDVVAQNGTKNDIVEVTVNKADGYTMDAKVTSEDSVQVKFNSSVVDTDKVEFKLRGSADVSINVQWNEDSTVATLTAPSALIGGAYTLTVNGLDFIDNKNTATLVVVENGVAKVEITSDFLALSEYPGESDGKGDLTLSYKLLDKYGVDITNQVSKSELEIAASVDLEGLEFDVDSNEGKMTLDVNETTQSLKEGDTVAVTIIAKDTGVATSESLKVAGSSAIDTIEIKGIKYNSGENQKILTSEANAAYILLDVKDQYGTEVTDNTRLNNNAEVLYVVSDNGVALIPEEYTTDDGKTKLRLAIDTRGINTQKNVNVTIISKLSGKSDSINLKIEQPAKPAEVKIGSLEEMVALGDVAEKLVLPVSVFDQDGVALTVDEIAEAYDKNEISINASGSLSFAGLKIATSGKNKGKIVNGNIINSAEGAGIITATTDTGVDTAAIDVKAAPYPNSFKYNQEPATNLLDGAITKFSYEFFDQYNRKMENLSSNYKVTLESSNNNIITVTPANTDALQVSQENAVTVQSAGAEGTAYITAKLYKTEKTNPVWPTDYVVVDTIKTGISVTDGVPGSLIFEIKDIPTLVAIQNQDGAIDGDDPYARPITITAKDSNGKIYAIPDSRIIKVTSYNATTNPADSDKSKYIMISSGVVNGDVKVQDGQYVVAARDMNDIDWQGNNTVTTLVRALISTNDGVKEVTKQVTISKDQPQTKEIIFSYIPGGGEPVDIISNPYEISPEAQKIDAISGTVQEIVQHKIYVYTVDQYGVYSKKTPTSFLVVNTDRYNGTQITYDLDNTLNNFTQNNIIKNEDVYLLYEAPNGMYATFKIVASDGVDKASASF